jgi:hypothetical protein
VKTLIAARKKKKLNPSAKENAWFALIGAKCPTSARSTTRPTRADSPCLSCENEIEDDERP